MAQPRRFGLHTFMTTILLLTLSNIFMTFAWYGHLKYPASAARESRRSQLADRACGILFSSPGEPHRILRVHRRSVKDHSGGHHPDRLFRLFGFLSKRTAEVELPRRFRHDHRSSIRDLQEVVIA